MIPETVFRRGGTSSRFPGAYFAGFWFPIRGNWGGMRELRGGSPCATLVCAEQRSADLPPVGDAGGAGNFERRFAPWRQAAEHAGAGAAVCHSSQYGERGIPATGAGWVDGEPFRERGVCALECRGADDAAADPGSAYCRVLSRGAGAESAVRGRFGRGVAEWIAPRRRRIISC